MPRILQTPEEKAIALQKKVELNKKWNKENREIVNAKRRGAMSKREYANFLEKRRLDKLKHICPDCKKEIFTKHERCHQCGSRYKILQDLKINPISVNPGRCKIIAIVMGSVKEYCR